MSEVVSIRGGVVTTRDPNEIRAEWFALCDEAKAGGWPKEFGPKLHRLQSEYNAAMEQRGWLAVAGFPFTPYSFTWLVDQFARDDEEAKTPLGQEKASLIHQLGQANDRWHAQLAFAQYARAELTLRTMQKIRSDLAEVQKQLDERWAAAHTEE